MQRYPERYTRIRGRHLLQNLLPALESVSTYLLPLKLFDILFLRAILDFKGMVTPAQYDHLMNFMYIESKESLAEFSDFVKKLGIKKIQGAYI